MNNAKLTKTFDILELDERDDLTDEAIDFNNRFKQDEKWRKDN